MINYYLITKPGIIFGNLVTVAAGFLLASRGEINWVLFFQTVLGLSLIVASACVFNNYIDRDIDKKMERTKERALSKGTIKVSHAILYAIGLGVFGEVLLIKYTNPLAAFTAFSGFFVYVILYSLWKCHTIYGTAIGSIAGAVPPLVGYAAASNQIDAGAIIFFAIMIFWQMPHFYSIAMYRFSDYAAAAIPVLPVKEGAYRTKWHMILYICGFIVATAALTFFNYTGYFYLSVASVLGLSWFCLCLRGFTEGNDQLWAKKMFRLSLVIIIGICLMIPLDSSKSSIANVATVVTAR